METAQITYSALIWLIRFITAGGSLLCLSSIRRRLQSRQCWGTPVFSCLAMERPIVTFINPGLGTIPSAGYTPDRTFRAAPIRELPPDRAPTGWRWCNDETLVCQSIPVQ